MRTLLYIILCLFLAATFQCQSTKSSSQPNGEITELWLKQNLKKQSPRLILQSHQLAKIKGLINNDPLVAKYFHYLKAQVDIILTEPLLERKQIGKRLLSVSREAMRRFTALSLMTHLTDDIAYQKRLEAEILAVCQFSDWNPSHFLDVAEMAMAVSLALDWSGDKLSPKTLDLARNALKVKALEASFAEDYFWIDKDNNWNQVCHGSLVAAAIVLADEHPSLAAKVIQRAVDNSPIALAVYGPDGGYPEGPGYWTYGTGFSCITFSLMESALGTDFDLSKSPGFLESATYKMMMATPSGRAYNYADNRTSGMALDTYQLLFWFALKTQNAMYFDRKAILDELPSSVNQGDPFNRLSSIAFLWLCDLIERQDQLKPNVLPQKGIWQGENPVAVVKGDNGFYFGFKGGRAAVNHGNADAGSFILQWRGVDWSMDLGNQSYNPLEQIMGNELWNRDQESRRWTLLSKNNFGHSTLTINDALHQVEGFAPIQAFRAAADTSYAQIDMTAVFGDDIESAMRIFQHHNDSSISITDRFVLSSDTKTLSWQLITRANIIRRGEYILLKQEGKSLSLAIESPELPQILIQSLSPPPLAYDIDIFGLKRLELRYQAEAFTSGKGEIKVRMTGL